MIKKPNRRRPNRYNAARDADDAKARLSVHRKQPTTQRWSLPLTTALKWVTAIAALSYIVQTLIIHGAP